MPGKKGLGDRRMSRNCDVRGPCGFDSRCPLEFLLGAGRPICIHHTYKSTACQSLARSKPAFLYPCIFTQAKQRTLLLTVIINIAAFARHSGQKGGALAFLRLFEICIAPKGRAE